MGADLPELILEDAPAWGAWLADRHAVSAGVWLVLAKRGGSAPTRLGYQEALEEALCYGWIAGQVGRRDEGGDKRHLTPPPRRGARASRSIEGAGRLTAGA